MRVWSAQDAKARFSELLRACMIDSPQMVRLREVEAAVLMSLSDWRRLNAQVHPSLKQLLLTDTARTESLVPARRPMRRRTK